MAEKTEQKTAQKMAQKTAKKIMRYDLIHRGSEMRQKPSRQRQKFVKVVYHRIMSVPHVSVLGGNTGSLRFYF